MSEKIADKNLATSLQILEDYAQSCNKPDLANAVANLVGTAKSDPVGLLARMEKWRSPEAVKMRKVVAAISNLAPFMPSNWSPITAFHNTILPMNEADNRDKAHYLVRLSRECFIGPLTLRKIAVLTKCWDKVERYQKEEPALLWEGDSDDANS